MSTALNSFILCPSCKCRVLANSVRCGKCGASLASMLCSRCGHPNTLNSTICIKCHTDLRIKKCSKCGTANIVAASICTKCHSEFGDKPQKMQIAKSGEGYIWAIIVFLCAVAICSLTMLVDYQSVKAVFIIAAIIGSIAVPISISIASSEYLKLYGVSSRTCLLVFVSGAALGTLAALIFYVLVPITALFIGLFLVFPVIVGASEELAKIVSIVWCLKSGKNEGQMIGLVFGVIAGLGFGALENVVYMLAMSGNGNVSFVIKMMLMRNLVCLLHAVWTGSLASIVWRDRRVSLQLTASVVGSYIIVAALHALWDISLVPRMGQDGNLAVMVVSGICSAAFFIFRLRYASLELNTQKNLN